MKMSGPNPIVLASGGTGGHVFPALAVAEELLRRGYPVCLATDPRGIDVGPLPPSVRVYRLNILRPGGGIVGKLRGGFSLLLSTIRAWKLLAQANAAGVIGFGGYPSVPTVLAAILRRLPSLIHEQNALLGLGNRLVASRVTGIALSFEHTAGLTPGQQARSFVTGNPVRIGFGDIRKIPYALPVDGTFGLLVLGGSQGARIFSEIVPDALSRLPEDCRARLAITQQCRPEDLDGVRARYSEIGLKARLETFFNDMPQHMAACHLVISRSGASTVAELAEAGRPSILVPYPHAAADHQTLNAQAVERQGGAWLMPAASFTAETLAARLTELIRKPQALVEAAGAMHRIGGRNAACALVDRLETILGVDRHCSGDPERAS